MRRGATAPPANWADCTSDVAPEELLGVDAIAKLEERMRTHVADAPVAPTARTRNHRVGETWVAKDDAARTRAAAPPMARTPIRSAQSPASLAVANPPTPNATATRPRPSGLRPNRSVAMIAHA